MAGVGFALRRLVAQDNLLGKGQAYAHGVMLVAGPWLLTILALGIVSWQAGDVQTLEKVLGFRTLLTYNFAFSIIATAPFAMLATRILSDALYRNQTAIAGSLLLRSILGSQVVLLVFSLILYAGIIKLPFASLLVVLINGCLLASIWICMVFLSAVRRFATITVAFMAGMLVSVAGVVLFLRHYEAVSGLLFFNVGLAILLGLLMAVISHEYPWQRKATVSLLPQAIKFWPLWTGALCYHLGLWADKFLMWFADDATVLDSGLRVHTIYDTAMFLAFLSVIPGMVFFVVHLETRFFEALRGYFRLLAQKGSWQQIEDARRELLPVFMRGFRNLILVQGSISILVIFLAPWLFSLPRFDFMQMGVFRIGVLAAFFQTMGVCLGTMLSYVDDRRGYLYSQILFLVINIVATLFFMKTGFAGYGYGFFVAAIITFGFLSWRVASQLQHLTYRLLFQRHFD